MKLTDEQIDSFLFIYKKEFGVELTREQATEKGHKLIRLIQLAYKPMSQNEFETIQARKKLLDN